ncbi:polysaccharide biosynthesis tyrosine autokinase [Corallincola luteus]|uniref:non-specific protein-tyrosine kinase n=1 Tax=Corallincola luteus TaxID=1775177 RepID=A0ABY2AMM1_9GAMM|nr:polysaccharide biosynthesis tyrosine autokinase [Corallincola luteus]TCI02603.1 polysaccharide biosynthesis tyrosine autokinase [Corallincola luteus]
MENTSAHLNKVKEEEVIDFGAYLKVIGQYKWRIFAFAIMVTIVTALITLSMTPKYRATATLLLEAEQAQAVSIEEIYGLDSTRKEYLQTQYEILKSRRLAEKVIIRLNLAEEPEFLPKPKSLLVSTINSIKAMLPIEQEVVEVDIEEQRARARSRMISHVLGNLSIEPIRNTQLVKITYEAESPALAATVANTLGDEFIKSHLEDKLALTVKASDWIRERLTGLRTGLRASEVQLQAFREQKGLVDIEGVVALASVELNEITSQLTKARQARSQAATVMRVLKADESRDLNKLETLPQISKHRLIQEAKRAVGQAEQRVAELSKRYGQKHNKMKAAQAQLTEAKASLQRQIELLVKGIEQEVEKTTQNEQALVAELADAKARYQQLSKTEAEYRELVREVDGNRRLYDTFLTRLKETGAVGDFSAAHARFSDVAEMPLQAAKPKKKIIVVAAFILASVLATLMAFAINALSDHIVTPEDVEQHLAQRIVGLIPKMKANRKGEFSTHSFFDKNAQVFAEAWRTLRTGLVLSHLDSPAKVLAVTSTIPNEGKTTTAINTAFALAQVEKVLLIDADIRKPSICKRFNIANYQPGLTNLLTGTHKLDQCIYHDPQSGLDILVAGSPIPNPLELLATEGFDKLITSLRQQYDRIVIDTPPASVVSDAIVVARHADSSLYVVRAEQVRRKVILESIGRLQQLKVRIDGVVLNCISERSNLTIYDYSYGSAYSDELLGNENKPVKREA